MKKLTVIITCMLLVFAVTVSSNPNGAEAQFEKLKSLEGNWQGKDPKGGDITVSYEVVSNGSAVMERIDGSEPGMVTMYHLDGENLMMTHYCAAMNQPRMKAALSDNSETIMFKMFDITNLAGKDKGHMHKLELGFKDADHISHAWTFTEAGKEMTVPFELTRQK